MKGWVSFHQRCTDTDTDENDDYNLQNLMTIGFPMIFVNYYAENSPSI